MKAVFIRRYGGSGVLEYGERPKPIPKRDQVLIKVHAASVNPRDWLLREGRYVFRFLTPPFPLILGSDVSGTVVEVGPKARRFKPGDAVFGMQTPLGGMGGYAEYIAISESALVLKPAAVSHEDAAAVPCAAMTAYGALFEIARVFGGARVLIIGASGGVGTYAVQIAKAFGADATAVTSAANIPLVRSLGADEVIDYKAERFADKVKEQDIIFDAIGRESLATCSGVLNRRGIYITTIPNLKNAVLGYSSRIARFLRGGNAQSSHIVLVRSDGKMLEEIAALMAEGKIRSVIDSVYPLSETKAAHDKSRSWRSCGKLILRVR